MIVLKFGGTSVGSPEALRRVRAIVEEEIPRGGLVVVSALSGTTDTLLKAVDQARQGRTEEARALREQLERRHWATAQALELQEELREAWGLLFQRLAGLLEGMGLLWEASPRARDAALAVGETLSARLVAALLGGTFRDVREVLRTDDRYGRARPDLPALREAACAWREELRRGSLLVCQGFLGSAPDGSTTTLGRGGSDTSATLLGEALGAEEVQIWTDVDGVLTADPSLVPEARPIPVMSLAEAAALSAFGAKVLHGEALAPVDRGGFHLVVANTHRPRASRTRIQRERPEPRPGSITSVAYKEGLCGLRLPPGGGLEPLLRATLELEEAGATRYGLLATPEGGLLLVRPEIPSALACLRSLGERGLLLEEGLAIVALVGEGLRKDRGRALSLLCSLQEEPIAGILAADTGVSLAFLVPEDRLPQLIPALARMTQE